MSRKMLPLLWRHAASLDNHEYIFFQYVKYHTNNVITIVFIVVIRVKLKALYLVLQQQRMHGYLHIHKNTRVLHEDRLPSEHIQYKIYYDFSIKYGRTQVLQSPLSIFYNIMIYLSPIILLPRKLRQKRDKME